MSISGSMSDSNSKLELLLVSDSLLLTIHMLSLSDNWSILRISYISKISSSIL